jgi:hypothetical protein
VSGSCELSSVHGQPVLPVGDAGNSLSEGLRVLDSKVAASVKE